MRLLRETARNSSHQDQVDAAVQVSTDYFMLQGSKAFFFHTLFLYFFVNPFFCFQALQKAVDAHEENLLWLKTRLNVLSEVSSEVEVQRQRTALAKLSTDLRALFSTLHQVHFRQLLYIYKRVFCTDFAI